MRDLISKNHSVPEDIIVLLIVITCLSDFSLFYLLLAARAELERNRIRDAVMQTQMQLEIYKSKQELYAKQGKRAHEHKNQLLTICHMLEHNQISLALKYTRRLTGVMAKELDSVNTNHAITDTI